MNVCRVSCDQQSLCTIIGQTVDAVVTFDLSEVYPRLYLVCVAVLAVLASGDSAHDILPGECSHLDLIDALQMFVQSTFFIL